MMSCLHSILHLGCMQGIKQYIVAAEEWRLDMPMLDPNNKPQPVLCPARRASSSSSWRWSARSGSLTHSQALDLKP